MVRLREVNGVGKTYLDAHKDVVFLGRIFISNRHLTTVLRFLVGHLFLANGEFALRLLVVLGVRLQLLDGLVLEDRDAKLDVGLGIFVTGLSLSSVPGFPAWTRKKNLHRPWCRRVTRPASCSEPCASPRRCPRRTCRSLAIRQFPASHMEKDSINNAPPWNSVSPVKTTLSSPSCMNQQMLSWVWHGVYRPLTEMLPSLKPSPLGGVCVTPSHSFPPMMGSFSLPSSES